MTQLTLISHGKTAEVYLYENNKVLKLFYGWVPEYLIANEYSAAKLAYEKDILTPRVYERLSFDGRQGILYDKLENITMDTLLRKQPQKAKHYGRQMAEIQYRIHQICAASELSDSKKGFATNLLQKTTLNEPQKQKLLDILNELPDGKQLLHGDFHPQNLLFQDKTPWIIDWTAATSGHPLADVAGTYLITKSAYLHHKLSFLNRFLTKQVLKTLTNAYLHSYFKLSGFTYKQMKAWLPVKAAIYLEVGLPKNCESYFHSIIEKG
ncbi:MAG: phosphotransferase [Erysipelotrichaceae bacterium]|jgi:uncharacterized protein (TIGR02172 family)|nr:phosphotransferase [Erysipelotrichaceae bacterium]